MRFQQTKNLFLTLLFIFFLFAPGTSQTRLQLILRTDKPIDSLLIIHWTDKEVSRVAYRDTLYVNFKTRGIDFYHLNYTIADGKPYYAPLFLDTGSNLTIFLWSSIQGRHPTNQKSNITCFALSVFACVV